MRSLCGLRCSAGRLTGLGAGVLSALLACAVANAAPQPVSQVTVSDHPDDDGRALVVRWQRSPDDHAAAGSQRVAQYEILRRQHARLSAGEAVEYQSVAKVPAGTQEYVDTHCERGMEYQYRVVALGADGTASAAVQSAPAAPVRQWFDRSKFWLGLIVAFVCGSVLLCTELARRGRAVYVRPIAGLKVIDEAVGRATEMGRPMLFIPGIQDLDQMETVAGLTVMAHIARKAAEYDTPLEVPTARVLVMSAAREMCEAAALAAGRPETYDQERIAYVTDDQFGYVAHVCGWMVRQRPAACFFLGKFYAESLILAETGRSVGAIQIGGTAEPAQLPFFVAACDYALIGEELFAASAYLSGEPQQLGTVRGQDWGKFLAMGLIALGCGLATAAAVTENSTAADVLHYLRNTMLSTGGAE